MARIVCWMNYYSDSGGQCDDCIDEIAAIGIAVVSRKHSASNSTNRMIEFFSQIRKSF